MSRAAWWLLFPAVAFAQDPLSRGIEIFNKSCATGYCHQVGGSAGGAAPRLAGRGFEADFISRVIQNGVAGTPMPGFGATLPRADLMAVMAYVNSLNGIAAAANPPANRSSNAGARPAGLSAKAQQGKELFSDPVLGFGRCATCHQVEGLGLSIASPIVKLPDSAAALKQLATPNVSTATADGDTFPALVLNQGSKQMKVYDLTIAPPVLVTFPKTPPGIVAGSAWRHASLLTAYSDADLEAVLVFLREALHR